MIEQKYINGLIECTKKYNTNSDKIKQFETKLDSQRDDLEKFIENTRLQVEEIEEIEESKLDFSVMKRLEQIMIDYENKVETLMVDSKPLLEEHEKIKKEIKTIYESIMAKYGNKYSEEEILDYIKTKL